MSVKNPQLPDEECLFTGSQTFKLPSTFYMPDQ